MLINNNKMIKKYRLFKMIKKYRLFKIIQKICIYQKLIVIDKLKKYYLI